MKRLHLIIFVAGSLLLASCKTMDFPSERGEEPTGTADTADVSIYHFEETPELDRSDTQELMGNYLGPGYEQESLFVSEENIAYFVSNENVNTTLEHNLKTGNFSFYKMDGYMGNFEPDLPSPDESQQVAQEYLDRQGLYPENSSQLKLIHQGGLRSARVVNNQRQDIIDKAITLTYGRVIDDRSVLGSGSKIVVQVGHEGEIIGLIRQWQPIRRKEFLTQSELVSEPEARGEAEKVIKEQYGDVEYRIENMFEAYHDNNGQLLQPVYGFETVIEPGQDLEPIRYLCVIPMLKNPPEDLNIRQLDPQARELIRKMQEGQDTDESDGEID